MKALRRLREEAALSQRDLSERSGVSQDTITRLETGSRKAQHKTVRKLAAALNVEPKVLVRDDD